MRKSYVTNMPNHIGAFLKASECFADLGINITRVSYNKAVDLHTLFIDVEGTEEQLRRADAELEAIGYLKNPVEERRVITLQFELEDTPGTVTEVLRLISGYGFNISYISSQQNGTPKQMFKMGLLVDDPEDLSRFIAEAESICPVSVVEYNRADAVHDNSVFYNSFVSGLSRMMDVSREMKEELLVNSNQAMQLLDDRGLSPYNTFDSISKLVEQLSACRGEAFSPRISVHRLTDRSKITLIEPPCGSNVSILESDGEALFVDCGYACYEEEMMPIIRDILPGFDDMTKRIYLTHADIDHIGFSYRFDEVYVSEAGAGCMREEYEGRDGFRESNPLHKPYVRICKALISYKTVPTDKVRIMWKSRPEGGAPLYPVGTFDFGEFHFDVYEGKGGHLKGETVLIDYNLHVAFTGDIYVNVHGMTADQARYNRYAPILMTSVDTDPELCKAEREAIFQRLGQGRWMIVGGHGGVKEYEVQAPSK